MGLRGPPPKPTAQRVLDGNPSGKPLNKSEPKPTPLVSIDAPSELSEDGKRVWAALSKELIQIGLLTTIDVEAFSRYINYLLEYRDCQRKIDGKYVITYFNPNGTPRYFQTNPYISIRNNAAANMLRLEREFGMTPAARVRMIAIATGNINVNDEDPYAA